MTAVFMLSLKLVNQDIRLNNPFFFIIASPMSGGVTNINIQAFFEDLWVCLGLWGILGVERKLMRESE